MKLSYGLILIFLTPLLASCEQLGLDTPAAEQAREEAEGKAIGGACRQARRALEDCYQINRKAPKAAIYTGWRDMDGYMRENKIEEVSQPEEKTENTPAKKQDAAAAVPIVPALPATARNEKAPEAKPAEALPARKARPPLSR